MASTITISPETRNVLHGELVQELKGAGDALAHPTSRDQADAGIKRAAWAISMLDAIGFDEKDCRNQYELPVEERLGDWLRRERAEVQEWVETDRNSLSQLEAGDERYCHVGYSLRESLHQGRLALARVEFDLATFEMLLDEVDELIGAVA
jgi:hypothetical protein